MAKMSANPIAVRIDAILEQKGLTRTAASRLAKLDPGYIRKLSEDPSRSGNLTKLAQLARALDVPLSELTGEAADGPLPSVAPEPLKGEARLAPVRALRAEEMPRDLPVLGTAAGSAVGAFQLTRDVIDYVRRPPTLVGVKEAYALYVENDSMSPMYRPGDLIFVHPHRPVRTGDTVVVQLKTSAISDIEAFIKIYSARTADWLVVEQLNPAATIKYKRESVVSAHKVLTMNDLFGV